jgi:hypothetical protein
MHGQDNNIRIIGVQAQQETNFVISDTIYQFILILRAYSSFVMIA